MEDGSLKTPSTSCVRVRQELARPCSPGGIGHALAREYHSRGFHVFATARNIDVLADLQELGLETLSLDVTLQESVNDAKDQVEKRTGGKLDCLINNAGRGYTMPATDVDFQEVYATFEANFFGVMRMCQTFAPLLIDAKGAIIQIGSVAAVMPYVFGYSIYQPLSTAYHRRLAQSQSGAMLNEDYARLVVSKVLAATASRDPPSYITSTGSGPGSSSGDVAGDVKVQLQLILTSVGTAIKSRVLSLFGARTAAVPIDYIWAGANASTVWFMNTFMPRGTWDVLYSKMYELHLLHQPSEPIGGPVENETTDSKKDL
ncbi:MAG: hypothetical protein M1815_002388 [Lichina confinis]|nr:MAG: hypothetical protein M1815_002388 [Lichina confinis]